MTTTIKSLLCLFLLLNLMDLKSQREFLATLNPATGVHTRIDSIPGVNYIFQNATAFDKNNHRYLFLGKDFGGQNRLYTVDALSGALISSPVCTLNAGELQYDPGSNTLFALELNNTLGKMFVVSINLNTAASTIIDTLPSTGYGSGTSFFNQASHSYVVHQGGLLLSMNVTTGSLTSVPVSANFSSLCFDNVNGFAYGLIMNPSMSLAKINVTTGTHTVISTFSVSGTSSTHKTFDEINQRYTFSSTNQLYSIAVNTGSIVSRPAFPVGLNSPENVVELHYDNSNAKLYALHWGLVTTTGINTLGTTDDTRFTIAPNPAVKSTRIMFETRMEELTISILNSLGQVVAKEKSYRVETVTLKLETLAKGVYFVQVSDKNKVLGIKKLVVE